MLKRMLCLLLLPALLCSAALADEYFTETAFILNGTVITPAQLSAALRFDLFDAAASCAANGYAYSIVDPDNIVDALDKTLFELQSDIIMLQSAEEMGLTELSYSDLVSVMKDAESQWQRYTNIIGSENGLAYLPAGFHKPEGGADSEEITRLYLAGFGVTMDELLSRAYNDMVEQKLKAAVTAEMADITEEERTEAYANWLVEQFDYASLEEDSIGIAEACVRLWPQ